MRIRQQLALALAASALALAACNGDGGGPAAGQKLPQGGEKVKLDPADFTTRIDNPFFPLKPGARWVYRETDPEGTRQRVAVTVTRKTRRIANGVTARVVRDVVSAGRRLVEKTDDWYAQDEQGNVWYLGEATTEYENGKPKTTKGSFEAGVDGAQAGVIMPAKPKAGMTYRQEHYADRAEDEARVFSLREQAEVPAGHYTGVLMTKEVNPLEPKLLEYKLYASGVGPVLAVSVSGGADREELVSYTRGG